MNMTARNGDYRPFPDCERITDPSRVLRLLEQLARRHALLTVDIPGHPDRYTSSIVDLDRDGVLLDELLPSDGHPLLVRERRLRVTGKLDGIEMRFVTTLVNVEERDGMITYHAFLPGLLEYRQRRNDFRAHIPMAQRLCVIIEQGDGRVIEGELHDLSHGGAGILLAADVPVPGSGQTFECALELPGAGWLYCTAETCHVRSSRFRDRQLVGVRFVRLEPYQLRLVGHCIIELEREQIRKRAAY